MGMTYPYDPDYVVHPGATLDEWFRFNNIPKTVVKLYGLDRVELEGIIAGTTEITPELARKLEAFTFVPAPFWLAMEHNFRVGLAAGKHWVHGPE